MNRSSYSSILGAWILVLGASLLLLLPGCSTQQPQKPSTAAVTQAPAKAPEAPTVAAQPGTALRVKAGSTDPMTDSKGNAWLADQGFDGGDVIARDENLVITNTADPKLYLTEHYGMSSFSCKVPNGKYTAKLHFAETFEGINGPGERVFSLNVQGHEFKDFDVWVKAGGPYRAYIETVPVEVTNGAFRIEFTSNVENPEINGIELAPVL